MWAWNLYLPLSKCSIVVFFSIIAEDAETELVDFKAWFDYFSRESCDPKVCSTTFLLKYVLYFHFNVIDSFQFSQVLSLRNGSHMLGEERRSMILEGEIRRLKSEYEKLALEKDSEVSELLAEKKFVWNQYKIMENDYTSKVGSNRSEVAKANEAVEKLLSRVEQLQSLNDERDEMIARLRNKVVEMGAETNELNEGTSRTPQKLDLLKKSRSSSVTPVLNCCTARAQRSCSNRSNITVKKESSAAQFPDSEKVIMNEFSLP
jgi:prefoldin subunit 5